MIVRMSERSRLLSRIRGWVSILPRPSIRGRTVLVLIPVHLVAFVLLYFGLVRVMRSEMLRTNSAGARIMISEAVHTLQPIMCSRDHRIIPSTIRDFTLRHSLLDFRMYRRDGSLLGQPGNPEPDVKKFLNGGDAESFAFVKKDGVTALQGIMRVRSKGDCNKCHTPGEELGAASIDVDLTPEVTAAHDRLENNLTILVIGWAVAVGFVNLGIGAWTRRSLAHVRLLEQRASAGSVESAPSPGAFLDPVAAELYRSLAQVLKRRQEEREAVSDRLHHTERLASLGQLAAGLAHEIKNPLAGIRGVMEIMRDDTEEESQKELFEQVVKELDRVNEIIHLLLNFARPVPPRREMVDVSVLLEDSVQLLRPALAKRNIALDVEVARDVASFSLDPSQIRHVITNLVANAADAIEEDGSIQVRASLFPEGGGLIISVSDDGPGIPESALKEIFEPFFTTKFSGTGLGLPVVRSLVAQHRGRVEVESEEGRGTTFFILFPDRPETDRDDGDDPVVDGFESEGV